MKKTNLILLVVIALVLAWAAYATHQAVKKGKEKKQLAFEANRQIAYVTGALNQSELIRRQMTLQIGNLTHKNHFLANQLENGKEPVRKIGFQL